MKKNYLIFLLIVSFVHFSWAIQSKTYIGHNLTPSTETIEKNKWTAGSYALAYGITDEIFVATSPWIWMSYNTANIHIKWKKDLTENLDTAVFISYFDSLNSEPLLQSRQLTPSASGTSRPGGPNSINAQNFNGTVKYTEINRYKWRNYSVHSLWGYHYSDDFTQYFNFKYSYYFNDEFPYSIRMDPGDDKIRDQIDVSTLFKSNIKGTNFVTGVELGALGVNYLKPYFHFGLSAAYQANNWHLQVGASYTAQFGQLGTESGYEIGRYDDRLHYSTTENQYYYYRYLQVAVHPEVQFQYNF